MMGRHDPDHSWRLRRAGRAWPLAGRPAGGFTLLEIMVVVVVLSVLAGGIIPFLHGSLAGLRLRAGTERIAALMDTCYHAAVATGRVHAIVFEADGIHYHVLAEPAPAPRDESGSTAAAKTGGDGGEVADVGLQAELDLGAEDDADADEDGAPALEPASLPGDAETALPEGVRLADSDFLEDDLARAESDSLRILFFPDGTTEFATLTFETLGGDRREVLLNGLSGAVSLQEPEPQTSTQGEE